MNLLSKSLIVVAALSVSACTEGGLFGRGGANDDALAPGAGAGVSDPTTVAYFQETVGDRVLFEVDQAVLTTSGQATLDAQASWLSDNPAYTAVVEGHADEQGTRQYNIALGARRADAAKAYLVSRGVAEKRLATVSFGIERPLAICSDEACYAQNRRAGTVLAAGGLAG